MVDFDDVMTKAYFYPMHYDTSNLKWPNFYFFMTSTNSKLLKQDEKIKSVKDGKILSEYYFRKFGSPKLMPKELDII